MIKPDFHKWIKSLSSHKSYQECIALSDKNLEEQYDIELALRFIIFSTLDFDQYDRSKDVGEYLTDRMVEMAQDNHFDEQSAEARFRETFDHLNVALGSNAFRRYSDGQFKGGFLLSPFEVIAFGLGFNHPDFPSPEETTERTQQLYLDATYQQWSGSGVRANSRLPHLIPLGREIFRP